MNRNFVLIVCVTLLAGCSSSKPTEEQLNNADYGLYPENYVDIAKAWLTDQYSSLSASGVRDLSIAKPVKGYQSGSLFDSGGPVFGYETEITYSVTASTGRRMATTRYRVLLLIRDGKVIRSKETTQ
ncbi:MAG: hypothetical protein A2X67_06405 [Ignavibacteria bacterium GWA2_55_11]|nr:MAG: hypothetical protein A2X67_06405 [Ignavibacteria bacterium GWA2_55_11]OGU46976.1 MAG: hypothetical protein A2X68_01715 [Ignavibacteria bacterium GWC2_56_12]HAV23807.1 hypothetical protein [Bacteroidota bacterium]